MTFDLQPVLSLQNLSKYYGSIHAVEDLSLKVEKGSVFGLLGPNGSGKTTTLGVILDIIIPTGGTYSWFGQPPSKATRKRIGAILENPNFYPYLSGLANLKLIADIKEVSHKQIIPMLDLVGLQSRKGSKYKTYSLGMKQRLAIAAAVLNGPEVLILDEPTNGLDPQGIADVRELIVKVANEGTTILLASHLLDEVQKVCTHVAVLKSGKKLFSGKVSDVLSGTTKIEVGAEDMNNLKKVLEEYPGTENLALDKDKYIVSLKDGFNAKELNSYLIERDILITHLSKGVNTLEKQFLTLLEESK